MKVGYLIGSHVVYNHGALPNLLRSMFEVNGIDRNAVAVVTNGCAEEDSQVQGGTWFFFERPKAANHFIPLVRHADIGQAMGITHWFFINCTSRCGPEFKKLVEAGFDPEADCTLAGPLLPMGSRGEQGRAINDLCMYRNDYLMAQRDEIMSQTDFTSEHAVRELEGVLFALAPKKARYPRTDYEVIPAFDVYESGTMRITEYYPGIDWFRFKKNWGQMRQGTYETARL